MSEKRLYLIDATAFCYRAFYALGGLSTSFGQPTNAIYGFTVMLNKILKEKKPEYMGACFDVSRDTFRQKKFAEYKTNRPAMPEGLTLQMQLIKDVIAAYGIPLFEKEGFEADDVIATLARWAKEKGIAVTIISSDKDILQLVDSDTVVFSPYKDEGVTYDIEKVRERFGVEPKYIPDIISLMGDDADNIPGVPGIGEKTATGLLKRFGSLEEVLSHLGQIKQEKLQNTITAHAAMIKLNKELAVLDKEVDLDFNLATLKIGQPNYKELFRLFKYLEFKKLIKALPMETAESSNAELRRVDDSRIKGLLASADTVCVYGGFAGMLFSFGGQLFQIDAPGPNAARMLSDRSIRKVGYDLKKMKVALARENKILDGLYFDVMVAAYLLNPSKSEYTLESITWDYLPEAVTATQFEKQKALEVIGDLQPILERALRDKSLLELFQDIEMPLEEVLAAMESTGIALDVGFLKELSAHLEKRLGELIEDIYRISGSQFNINSPKQLRTVLFENLKLPVVKRTKSGPSTDEEVLRRLAASHELPALLLEYRQLMKLKSTYIDALPALVDPKTGRIHTSFNQTATETGRLSSTNPNLQNIPIKTEIGSKIRKAVIAFSRDSYLLSCDYSQIELRILAHLSHDEDLISAFKQDKDIHRATASLIYNVAEKAVTGPMREVAKRVNFGIVYGLTSYGLSRDLGIPLEQAQGFIDAYFNRYPRVKEYTAAQIEKAQRDGFVTTMLGRRRYIPDISHKNQAIRQFAERQAVNTPIQGSASDLIKLAMIQIHREIEQKKMNSRMILQIHDELVFDVARAEMHDFAAMVKDKMEQVLRLDVPVKVSMKKGKNWLEMEEIIIGSSAPKHKKRFSEA